MDAQIQYLFVYGTLRPSLAGDEQRALIAELTHVGPATVRGLLYDLGSYPGLVAGEGTVHGDLLTVAGKQHLALLDAYEECSSAAPLYRRMTTVATQPDGTTVAAWAYLYGHALGHARLIEGGDYVAFKIRHGSPQDSA